MEQIVWQRWLIYAVFGVPFLAWLFFTKQRWLRVIVVAAMLVLVQGSFADRRYLWAVGIGPSVITAYTAFMALALAPGRTPGLRGTAAGWILFLLSALVGLTAGSLGIPGELPWQVNSLQELYLEGLLFFLVGAMGMRTNEDVRKYVLAWLAMGVAVALTHYFCLATGYRLRGAALIKDRDISLLYGGHFINPNTQGAFYAMTIPAAMAIALARQERTPVRLYALACAIVMTGSLILSWHRGGFISTTALLLGVLIASGVGVGRTLMVTLVGVLVVGTGYLIAMELFPDILGRILETKGAKGLETERYATWLAYVPVVFTHPFGVGITPESVLRTAAQYQIAYVPHNIYLNFALQVGFLGFFAFFLLVTPIVLRNVRAWRLAVDVRSRTVALLTLIPLGAFFLVGISEPLYDNGHKINNLFWLVSGVSLASSLRLLEEARSRRAARQDAELPGSMPAIAPSR